MVYYFDMDGVLANFHKAYASDKKTALKRSAMANLEPFAENVNLVKSLIKAGEKVYILTKAANEDGKAAKYIAELDKANFICIVGSGKKVDFIREAGVLVDDDPKNITPWEKAGFPVRLLATKGEAVAF